MSSTKRHDSPSLSERLAKRPGAFQFFQAVRLLELAGRRKRDQTQSPRGGGLAGATLPKDEPLRFAVPARLDFPHDEILSFDAQKDKPRLGVSFFGLIGPSGVLPRHYTHLAIARRRQGDHALIDFFNAFQHRLITLFYKAWRKNRVLQRVEEHGGQSTDPFSRLLLALVGQSTSSRSQQRDLALKCFFAGHLSRRHGGPEAIERVLSGALGLPVKLVEFTGGGAV